MNFLTFIADCKFCIEVYLYEDYDLDIVFVEGICLEDKVGGILLEIEFLFLGLWRLETKKWVIFAWVKVLIWPLLFADLAF